MNFFPGKALYMGLILLAIIDLAWVYVAGHSLDMESFTAFVKLSMLLFFAVMLVRYFVMKKVAGEFVHQGEYLNQWRERILAFLEGMLFISIGWMFLRLFNHLSMTWGFPYADAFLTSADQAMGLNWNVYFEFVAASPQLISIFDYTYTGLTALSMVAFIGLIVSDRLENARFFVTTFVTTAVICTTIGMFFPAKAAVHELLINRELMNNFPFPPGIYSVDIIANLRSGTPQIFDFGYMPGLTTFPSFHTAAGVVLAYSYRGTRLFWVVLLYTIIMIASTPVYGGHYFIDVVAGIIVALVICVLFERRNQFRGMPATRGDLAPSAPQNLQAGE